MSAAIWLAFVFGVILVAIYGSILIEMVLPTITVADAHSSTQASATGIDWYASFWEWMPLVLMILLLFALFVKIIVRRRRVPR